MQFGICKNAPLLKHEIPAFLVAALRKIKGFDFRHRIFYVVEGKGGGGSLHTYHIIKFSRNRLLNGIENQKSC